MARPNSKGMHPNGRSASPSQFTMVLHAIQEHPDYISLSAGSRGFLWDMAKQYNGRNNGQLKTSLAVMGPLGYSKDQCTRYRAQLEHHGWIQRTREPRTKKEAILYRLTWLDLDKWTGAPSLDPGVPIRRPKSLRPVTIVRCENAP